MHCSSQQIEHRCAELGYRMKCGEWRRRILRLAVSGTCALLIGMSAQAQSQNKSFNIAGGDLKLALDIYLVQAGVQLIYKIDDIKGLSTKGVKGVLTSDAALERLLEGTRLRVQHGADGSMVIVLVTAVNYRH